MQLNISIPDDLVLPLQAAHGSDLGRAALERLVVDGYRAGTLSAHQVQQLLNFTDRYMARAWLGRMGASENYTLADLEADRAALDRLLVR